MFTLLVYITFYVSYKPGTTPYSILYLLWTPGSVLLSEDEWICVFGVYTSKGITFPVLPPGKGSADAHVAI